MFALRDYQITIIDQARDAMQAGVKSLLITAPTGSGKTALTAYMLQTAASKGMRSLFLVHRRELIKQSVRTFAAVGVRHGIIAAGFIPDPRHRVQIGSVQTYARRMDRFTKPALIIWDEAHHVAAGSWDAIYKENPQAYHVGLTATPERLDGKGLGGWFKTLIKGPTSNVLIGQGWLSKYRLIVPPGGINTDGVHRTMGDYNKTELMAAADKPTITGDAVKHYLKFAEGKRAVAFCVSIDHSRHVVSKFREAGIPAAHVDGETEMGARDEAIRAFEAGDIKILSNVELFGEGFDLPAIEAAILLRPTQSLGLYLQQVGRALRPSPGKDAAIILDHAGNCLRHGLPDQDREWSLDGYAGGKSGRQASSSAVKVCPQCFAAQRPGHSSCQVCGRDFEVKGRDVIQATGELVELDIDAARAGLQKKREQWGADSLEALTQLGVKRGYRNPRGWAHAVFQARQAKKLKGAA